MPHARGGRRPYYAFLLRTLHKQEDTDTVADTATREHYASSPGHAEPDHPSFLESETANHQLRSSALTAWRVSALVPLPFPSPSFCNQAPFDAPSVSNALLLWPERGPRRSRETSKRTQRQTEGGLKAVRSETAHVSRFALVRGTMGDTMCALTWDFSPPPPPSPIGRICIAYAGPGWPPCPLPCINRALTRPVAFVQSAAGRFVSTEKPRALILAFRAIKTEQNGQREGAGHAICIPLLLQKMSGSGLYGRV